MTPLGTFPPARADLTIPPLVAQYLKEERLLTYGLTRLSVFAINRAVKRGRALLISGANLYSRGLQARNELARDLREMDRTLRARDAMKARAHAEKLSTEKVSTDAPA